jgi:hypothetical protein
MANKAVASGKLSKTKPLTFGELPNNPENNVCLHCPFCGLDYSCARGDYCTKLHDAPIKCGSCNGYVVLAVKRMTVSYRPITPAVAERR